MALDQTQDLTGAEQRRLQQLHQVPEFVKTAAHDRLCGHAEGMAPHLYAAPAARLYPIHTAPAVWLSTAFFEHNREKFANEEAAEIERRLDESARYFAITAHTDKIKTAAAAATAYSEAAEPDDVFALVWTDADGRRERHYPLRNAVEIKAAADWFSQYRDDFVWDDRHVMAQRIADRAFQHGVDIPETILKTAGHGYCPAADAVEAIRLRAALTARAFPAESAEMRKLAALAERDPLTWLEADMRVKLASVFDKFDRATKLREMYDDGLDRPEEALFFIPEKAASEFLNTHVQLTSGTVYERAEFEKLSLDHVRDWMGDEFADEISSAGLYVDAEKTATVAATLPRGDAEMFDRMARAGGVQPRALDKAASAMLTVDDLAELAGQLD